MKTLQAPPRTALVLAQLLERLDASRAAVDPHQYQSVVQRLAAELADPGVSWDRLLENSAASATLYENLHYAEAGLCRSALDAAASAEVAARQAIEKARRRAAPPADAAA